jgi:hypothetical protein
VSPGVAVRLSVAVTFACTRSLRPIRDGDRADATLEEPHVAVRGEIMGKTGRKRRARKKKGANHGKRPNA